MDTNGFNEISFCECKSKISEFKEKNLTYTNEKGTYFNFELRSIESSLGVIAFTPIFHVQPDGRFELQLQSILHSFIILIYVY